MKQKWLIILLICISLTGCASQSQEQTQAQPRQVTQSSKPTEEIVETKIEAVTPVIQAAPPSDKYKKIEVDGGDMSGYRQANVVVDIGFGDREYWAYTNEYGQLIRVTAKQIILQDDTTEPVKSNGRYYNDEAKVSGVERADLDEGHVIADSLGGVSNAYNITPQESTLNRYGDQAYMEKVIRDVGGCTDFEAVITYPDTSMQISSHYHYTYTLKGNVVTDGFDDVNPDEVNKTISEQTHSESAQSPVLNESHDISFIDKNGNSQVTICICGSMDRWIG